MDNWITAKEHIDMWWKQKGLVLSIDGLKSHVPHANLETVEKPLSCEQIYTNSQYVALENRKILSKRLFLADTLPIAMPDMGTVSLCTYLGSEPKFSDETIWYSPCIIDPDNHPTLRFDKDNRWWKITKQAIEDTIRISNGNYLIGCPALTPGLDCLAMLRGTEELMMDMIESPEWVKLKLNEINKAYFEIAEIIYQIISLEDGSSAFGYFTLWGYGKTAQVQCDVSAMISPAMFSEFVVPSLKEQCNWLDNSMFHLDGTQCLCHIDQLLALSELKAIEWTPQEGIESGGNKRWYPLYRKILNAGKSVQVFGVQPEEVLHLLEEIGNNGVYIMTGTEDENVAYNLINVVEKMWR
jgi:hypothetical protein